MLMQAEEELASVKPEEVAPAGVRWDLVYLWAAAGQRERAEAIIRPLTNASERDQLTLRMIAGLTSGGEAGKATKIVEAMPEKAQEAGFREIVTALARRGNMAEAERFAGNRLKGDQDILFFVMLENRDHASAEALAIKAKRTDLLDSVVGCRLLVGDVEGAAATAEKLPKGMAQGVQKRIEAMKADAPFRRKWAPVERKYALIGSLSMVQDPAWTSLSRNLAVALTSGPKSEDATTALTLAATDASSVKAGAPQATAYTYLAIGAAECGDVGLAANASSKAFTAALGSEASGEFCRTAGGWLMIMLVRQGSVDDAMRLALTVQKVEGPGPLVAQWLGYSLTLEKKKDRFFAYMHELKKPSHRLFADLGAAKAMLAKGTRDMSKTGP